MAAARSPRPAQAPVPALVADGAMTCATTSSLAAVTGASYRMTAGSSSASASPFDAVERGLAT